MAQRFIFSLYVRAGPESQNESAETTFYQSTKLGGGGNKSNVNVRIIPRGVPYNWLLPIQVDKHENSLKGPQNFEEDPEKSSET